MHCIEKVNKYLTFVHDRTFAALHQLYKQKQVIAMNYADKIEPLI